MRNNQTTNAAAPKHKGRRFRAMFLLSLMALAAVMFASLSLGSSTIGATDVAAFVAGNASDMANNVLQAGQNPDVRKLAQEIVTSQQAEITEMNTMLGR